MSGIEIAGLDANSVLAHILGATHASLLKKLKEAGLAPIATLNSIKLAKVDKDGNPNPAAIVCSASLKMAAVKTVMVGDATATTADFVKASLLALCQEGLNQVSPEAEAESQHEEAVKKAKGLEVSGLAPTVTVMPTPEPVVETAFGGFPVLTPSAQANANRVKLCDAGKLYQPVYGTSSGSRYYLVARSQNGLNFAVRIKDGAMSCRVEPMAKASGALSKFASSLASVGFSVNDTYASIHMQTHSEENARRAAAAVLAAAGVAFVTPFPDMMRL